MFYLISFVLFDIVYNNVCMKTLASNVEKNIVLWKKTT